MTFLLRLISFSLLALVIGIGSAWYMIDNGAFFATSSIGPWQTWSNEGRLDADPYTRARMARSGRLPVTGSTALYFTASEDSEGSRLSSECDYEISGRPINSLWWSIAAYDGEGQFIRNKAERYSFNSKNIALLPDGSFKIRLAPKARPGNWLPSDEADDPMLILRVFRPQNNAEAGSRDTRAEILPSITRLDCG